MKKISVFIVAILITGIALQVAFLVSLYLPDLVSVRKNLGKSSVWRGANFNQSEKVADFIEFLNQNIPENERVVLPTLDERRKILKTPYIQFFLSPRKVINCRSVECVQSFSNGNAYLLLVGEMSENTSMDGTSLMFDENWGVLIPESPSPGDNISELKDFNSLWSFFSSGLLPLIWIGWLTITGTIIVISLLPQLAALFRLALGYGMGLGLFSLGVVTLVVVGGFPLEREVILWTTFLLSIMALGIFVIRERPRNGSYNLKRLDFRWEKPDFLPLIFIGIGVIVIMLAVGKGYHRTDAIQIWGVKGYGIARSGTLDSITDWGTNTLAYPLHIPTLIAAFRILFGDVLPSSKMIFGGYYLALMLVIYYTLIELDVKRWLSCISVLLMMTSPIIFRHATIGYVNLTITFYLVSGVVILILSRRYKYPLRYLFLSSIFLVYAAWTRPEGMMLALGSSILLMLLLFFDQENQMKWKKVAGFVTPPIIYVLFWEVVKKQVYPEPYSSESLTSKALHQIFSGNLHNSEAYYIIHYFLKELVNFKVFGGLGLIILFGIIIILVSRKPLPKPSTALISVGGLWIVMIVGLYFVLSYHHVHDLSWWVISGLNRMNFPGLIVLWLGLIPPLQNVFFSEEEAIFE